MTKLIAVTSGIAGVTVLTFFVSVGAIPAQGFEAQNGQIHIEKDCDPSYSQQAGYPVCKVVSSNFNQIPVGSFIYYEQASGGPTAGPGFLDSNIFVYVKAGQWAVGRCTLGNDNSPGLCTLSDGSGALAGLRARLVVTYQPGGDGALYAWNGVYSFDASVK